MDARWVFVLSDANEVAAALYQTAKNSSAEMKVRRGNESREELRLCLPDQSSAAGKHWQPEDVTSLTAEWNQCER